MPFVPLTLEEKKWFHKNRCNVITCRNPRHNPPAHIVVTHPLKYVCPHCNKSVMLLPDTINLT